MLHITFSKYDCIIVHKAYYLFTCTCVSINSFHSHSHSQDPSLTGRPKFCIAGMRLGFGKNSRNFYVFFK